MNEIRITDITAHLEPDSLILRDIQYPNSIRILEQNYESDPHSQGLFLRKSEGKNLIFETELSQSGKKKYISGKVLRSGYVPHMSAFQQYGQRYAYRQMN